MMGFEWRIPPIKEFILTEKEECGIISINMLSNKRKIFANYPIRKKEDELG